MKERDEKNQTLEVDTEEKWLRKKCKAAKSQVKDTIDYLKNNSLHFRNNTGKTVALDSKVEVLPIVVFKNDKIKNYDHLLKKHTEDGLDVNCLSFEDYAVMCEKLISPVEIVDYLKWRQKFYVENGSISMMISETDDGVAVFNPQHRESLISEYLKYQYGDMNYYFDNDLSQIFNAYVYNLSNHTVIQSEDDAAYEIIKVLAHFHIDEIKAFVERTTLALELAKKKEYKLIVGNMRNTLKHMVTVFEAPERGTCIPSEILLDICKKNTPMSIDELLQVVCYWESELDYRIDFVYFRK